MLIIGLMSGTSADGVGAALVEVAGRGRDIRVELREFLTDPYPRGIRNSVLDISRPGGGTTAEVAALNTLLGERFAKAAIKVCRRAATPITTVDFIGSHGQTVAHLPERHSTLQIGEPAVIAAVTQRPVVADFRPADIAAGGQGAPLTPLADYLLFRNPKLGRGVLNIGGICNITFLPAGIEKPDDLIAFDTGPGNMLLDAMTAVLSRGKKQFDNKGNIARSGKARDSWLEELMRHPFFKKKPPKSAGREQFGAHYLDELLAKFKAKGEGAQRDLLATLAESVALSVAAAIEKFILPRHRADDLLACGGGASNEYLMERIGRCIAPIKLGTTDNAGVPADAREAIAFALLARETWEGRPGNVPAATGAKRAVTLGKIIRP